MGSTFGAIPFTNIERQAFNDVSTLRAQFAGREEAVNQLFGLSVPFAFVVNHLPKSSHADIENCAGETMVGGHAPHVQILNADHVEPSHKVSGKLVEGVGPAASDMLIQASNFYALSLPSSTTLFATGKNALQSGQLGDITPKIARVCNAFTVRQGSKTAYPQVNTNRLPGLRQPLDFFIEAKSDKVPPGRFLDYRNRCGGTIELSTPTNIKTTEAGKNKVFIYSIPLKSADSVFSGLLVSFLFERGIASALCPEIQEGGLKVTKSLLGWNTRNIGQPLCRFLFLQSSQQCRCVKIVDSFLFCSPGLGTNIQSPIIHVTTAAEDTGKLLRLGAGWVESEPIPRLHINSIYYVKSKVNNYFNKGAAVPPTVKTVGFLFA